MKNTLSMVASAALATAFAVLVSLLFLLPRSHVSYRPGIVVNMKGGGEILRYSMGSYGADLLASIPGLVLPLIVLNTLGEKANAYFYTAWMFSALITAIPYAITTSLFVEGSHDERTFIANAKKSIKLSFLLLIPVLLGIFLFGRFILSLYGAEFAQFSTSLLFLLSCASLFMVFIMVYLTQRRILKDVKGLAQVSFALLSLQLGLGYVLMKLIGINGVGIAILISYASVALPIVYKWIKPIVVRYFSKMKYTDQA